MEHIRIGAEGLVCTICGATQKVNYPIEVENQLNVIAENFKEKHLHAYKVLTVHQPYASLLVLGHKRIETRSWNAKYRGKLLIHAGVSKPIAETYLKLQGYTIPLQLPVYSKLPFGSIIGSVDLIDCIKTEDLQMMKDTNTKLPSK